MKKTETNQTSTGEMVTISRAEYEKLLGQGQQLLTQNERISHLENQVELLMEALRLAPSATNSQPWFFLHEGDVMHAYRVIHGPVRQRMLGRFNQMDMGIALAHLYVSNPDAFQSFRSNAAPEKQGYTYVLSFRL